MKDSKKKGAQSNIGNLKKNLKSTDRMVTPRQGSLLRNSHLDKSEEMLNEDHVNDHLTLGRRTKNDSGFGETDNI